MKFTFPNVRKKKGIADMYGEIKIPVIDFIESKLLREKPNSSI